MAATFAVSQLVVHRGCLLLLFSFADDPIVGQHNTTQQLTVVFLWTRGKEETTEAAAAAPLSRLTHTHGQPAIHRLRLWTTHTLLLTHTQAHYYYLPAAAAEEDTERRGKRGEKRGKRQRKRKGKERKSFKLLACKASTSTGTRSSHLLLLLLVERIERISSSRGVTSVGRFQLPKRQQQSCSIRNRS